MLQCCSLLNDEVLRVNCWNPWSKCILHRRAGWYLDSREGSILMQVQKSRWGLDHCVWCEDLWSSSEYSLQYWCESPFDYEAWQCNQELSPSRWRESQLCLPLRQHVPQTPQHLSRFRWWVRRNVGLHVNRRASISKKPSEGSTLDHSPRNICWRSGKGFSNAEHSALSAPVA